MGVLADVLKGRVANFCSTNIIGAAVVTGERQGGVRKLMN